MHLRSEMKLIEALHVFIGQLDKLDWRFNHGERDQSTDLTVILFFMRVSFSVLGMTTVCRWTPQLRRTCAESTFSLLARALMISLLKRLMGWSGPVGQGQWADLKTFAKSTTPRKD